LCFFIFEKGFTRKGSFLSFDSQLSSPSTPFMSEFLSIYALLLTKGHTKLPFAVFVGRLANPLSHEAFSGKLYSICVPLWFLFFTNFLFHIWVFPSFCEDTIKLGFILSSIQFSVFKLFSMISISFKIIVFDHITCVIVSLFSCLFSIHNNRYSTLSFSHNRYSILSFFFAFWLISFLFSD
jgi:hypothetical protein